MPIYNDCLLRTYVSLTFVSIMKLLRYSESKQLFRHRNYNSQLFVRCLSRYASMSGKKGFYPRVNCK